LSTEGNFGNYSGPTIGFNYLSKQKISFQLGIHTLYDEIDQHQGESIFGGEYNATNEFRGFHFLVGKVFSSEGSPRLNLSAGIGSTMTKKAVSSQLKTSSYFGWHYSSIEYQESQSLTFIFNPKIEFPFSEIFGISLTSHLMVNKDAFAFGFGIGFLLGALK
jgi:hypothetical protein